MYKFYFLYLRRQLKKKKKKKTIEMSIVLKCVFCFEIFMFC